MLTQANANSSSVVCDLRRLAVFVDSLGQGGIGKVRTNLANELTRQGVQVDLLTARADSPYHAQLDPRISVLRVGTSHALHAVPFLANYLWRARPDALLASRIRVDVAALRARALSGARTRVYATIDTNLTQQLGSLSEQKRRSQLRYMRRYYPRNEGIIAVSQGVAQDFARLMDWPGEAFAVIPNPIVTQEMFSLARAPVPHPWLDDGHTPVVMGAGRLEPQKDFLTLLRAFARVRRERPCRLIILGEGHLRPEIEALAFQLGVAGDLAMPGFVSNPHAYTSRARLFVLSSAWEGLGNVLVEALALGIPVVATDCPSGPREILQDGRFGPLVPVGDAEALAAAMLDTLNDPLGSEFLQSAVECYTGEFSSRQYMAAMGLERLGAAS
jgi:glycosyltransferase involved in cell wall biosynthesis